MLKRTLLALTAAAGALGGAAQAVELASASRLAFGPDRTLFVADWKAGQVDALSLPSVTATRPDAPFNVMDLDAAIQSVLGATDIRLESLAKRPGTTEVYLAVSVGPDRRPAILVATPDGVVRALDLPKLSATVAKLENPPTGDFRFWNQTSMRSFTVTDMQWHAGELYVAGVSNGTFASSLRILGTPFDGSHTVTSVAMYHTTHNEVETRAPPGPCRSRC